METRPEYRACEALQREVWGQGFSELVPASVLKIARAVGGVASGAFGEEDGLAGFVFGLTGVRDGHRAHWSHMLAVRPGLRGSGLGTALKRHQRELLVGLDVGVCYWTYDPIVSKNAYLNLNHLLATVDRYVEDMYGETGSTLHRGLGTDRFVVRWELGRDAPDPFDPSDPARGRLEARLAGHAGAPVANPGGRADAPLPAGVAVRVAIPPDIHAVREADPGRAARWREGTRRAFLHYLEGGWRVLGYVRPPGGALAEPPGPRADGPDGADAPGAAGEPGHYVLVRP